MRFLPILFLLFSLLGCDGASQSPANGANGQASPTGKSEVLSKEALVKRIKELGGTVEFDEENPDKPVTAVKFIRRGDTNAELKYLKGLTELKTLDLNFSYVTDAGLKHLKGLTNLQTLYLSQTRVRNAGLEHLKGLTNLQTLYLIGTNVTNDGLVHLSGLTNLQTLFLSRTSITDAGLGHLKELTSLQDLRLDATDVTDEGAEELRKALPNCTVALEGFVTE